MELGSLREALVEAGASSVGHSEFLDVGPLAGAACSAPQAAILLCVCGSSVRLGRRDKVVRFVPDLMTVAAGRARRDPDLLDPARLVDRRPAWLVSHAMSQGLTLLANGRTPVGIVALVILAQPPFSALLAWGVLGEAMTGFSWLAARSSSPQC